MPHVAIITPTYNRGSNCLLKKTMLSVLGQTYENFVHMIVDDGSTDNTPYLVGEYAKNDSRIVYYRRERKLQQKFGASPASNYGIEMLGEFPDVELVTFLHSDDLYARDNIEKKVAAFQDPDVRMAYSWLGCFHETEPSWIIKVPDIKTPAELAVHLRKRWEIAFPYQSLMIARHLLEKAGGFDENMGFGEDKDFTVRVLAHLGRGQMAVVPEILHYYRVHDESVTGLYKRTGSVENEFAYMFSKHGRTRVDATIEAAKKFMRKPHSFLPEYVKRQLRPIRDGIVSRRGEFDMDPFVKQIENSRLSLTSQSV